MNLRSTTSGAALLPAAAPSLTRPARFVGAKRAMGVWQRIISEMPRHRVFVELFAGTGYLTRMKLPAERTILVDLDRTAPAATLPLTMRACKFVLADYRAVLGCLDLDPATLVYADPPYPLAVRSCQRSYYKHELVTDAEHRELLGILAALPALVMISGYRCPLYDELLSQWRRCEIPTVDRRGNKKTECVWMNFPPTANLHDTRFVGDNYRQRLRIRRKVARWLAMLEALPLGERAALTAAIDDWRLRGERWQPWPAMRRP